MMMSHKVQSWSKKTKTILNGVFLCFVACVFAGMVACSGSGSGSSSGSSNPSAVAKKACEAIVKKDAKALSDCLGVYPSDEKYKENLAILQAFLNNHYAVKYEILDEKIAENGERATVSVKYIDKDGNGTMGEMSFAKKENGWKLQL